MVKSNNTTRWNSTYESILRALALRPAITFYYIAEHKDLSDFQLSEEDWTELTLIVGLLEPFLEITKHLEGHAVEGHHGLIWEVLPCLEALLLHLEEAKAFYTEDVNPYLCGMINQAWLKLSAYYQLTDESPVYATALALHPAFKQAYFDERWTTYMEEFIQSTKDRIKQIWLNEYAHLSCSTNQEPENQKYSKPALLNTFLNRGPLSQSSDEFDLFQSTLAVNMSPEVSPYDWWSLRDTFPRLGLMAYDYLSIPAMSSECERIFSGAKLTLTTQRHRLKADIVEAVELLGSWFDQA
jgi:hypothetical protein